MKIKTLILIGITFLYAQCPLMTLEELKSHKTYTNLEEALQDKRKVYSLDIANKQIKELTPQIKKLRCLQRLDLQQNQLKRLPEEITKLKKLQYLYLQDNQLQVLPIRMERLRHLKLLDVRGNPLSKEEIGRVQMQLPQCEILYDE